jgi:hypothetical protein
MSQRQSAAPSVLTRHLTPRCDQNANSKVWACEPGAWELRISGTPHPVQFSWNLQLALIGLRPIRALFSIDSMTFTSIRHAHSHHGLTGRGALLRVHVRL